MSLIKRDKAWAKLFKAYKTEKGHNNKVFAIEGLNTIASSLWDELAEDALKQKDWDLYKSYKIAADRAYGEYMKTFIIGVEVGVYTDEVLKDVINKEYKETAQGLVDGTHFKTEGALEYVREVLELSEELIIETANKLTEHEEPTSLRDINRNMDQLIYNLDIPNEIEEYDLIVWDNPNNDQFTEIYLFGHSVYFHKGLFK